MPIERQLPDLVDQSKEVQDTKGTLRLDAALKIPKYHTAVDIHCQPGAYHSEFVADDVSAGALYDRAVYVYAMGRMGPFNEDMGASQVAYIKANFPGFSPKRILDLGCAVGHSTLPYVDAYPEAEVHAVDVAAPMLRYAHARAQSLGKKVHFSQQNAECMDFEDGSFDLIVSHILLHETSAKALKNILSECFRLLAPDGLMAHSETPPYKNMDEYDAFMLDWDTYNNNEPFWGYTHELDLDRAVAEAGFDATNNFEALAPSAFVAAQHKRTNIFQGGDFGGGGVWYLWGCWKR
jgi:SAM-dependent methyltransferase